MIISHQRRFIFIPDPLATDGLLSETLEPWADQQIDPIYARGGKTPFYKTMTPTEVEWAFDAMGLAFRSYLRITVVQNPFVRLSVLYDRIAHTDAMWQVRQYTGIGLPSFSGWLRSTKPDGNGAGTRTSPSWRRYGAWSAKAWCGPHISHTIRREYTEQDLSLIFGELGIAPALPNALLIPPDPSEHLARYTPASALFVADRYRWDLAQFNYENHMHRAAA